MGSREERETVERFAERYRAEHADVHRRIEQTVIGGDWGANGYTTMAQADELGRTLDLGPDRRLLDIGAGRGRPAFCTIHPTEGLTASQRRRAARDGPVAVATSRTHRELLTAAGFVDISDVDVTDEFRTVARAWIDQWDAHRDELVEALGATA